MKLFICALALSFALEGICFALFPALARKCMEEALKRPDSSLRTMGACALATSVFLAVIATWLI